jgi:TP901 family phage tail tape measure protein
VREESFVPSSDVIVRFIAETKGFDLSKLDKELAQTRGYAEALNTTFASFKTLALASGASLLSQVLPMVIGSKAVADYNTNISLAAGINSDLADNLDEVNSKVNQWALQYGVAADDIAAGILEMVKADMDWNDILNDMDPALQLAIANNMSLADTTDTLVKVTALWGDENLSAAQMANMMQVAAKRSIMDVSDLGDAIRASGSQAAMAGVDYAQFLAAAASLSNIGAKMGYNWGTFYTRILTTKDTLATVLGDSSWILGDGSIDFTLLIEAIKRNINDPAVMQEIARAWGGQRSLGAAIQASIIGEGGYQDILASLTSDTGALTSASDAMANSITNTWTRVQEAILAPLRDQNVMDAFSSSLNTIASTLSSPGFTQSLQTIMLTSADFVEKNGPKLVDMVVRLLDILVQMGPTLTNFANMGLNVADMLTAIPTPVWELIAGLYIINRIIPAETVPALIMGISNVGGLKNAISLCTKELGGMALGLGAVYLGATMLNSDNPIFRFLGLLVIAIGAVTAAYSAYFMAKTLALGGTNLPIAIAAAAGATALVAGVGLAAATNSPSTAAAGEAGGSFNVATASSASGSWAGATPSTFTYIDQRKIYQGTEDDISVNLRAYQE